MNAQSLWSISKLNWIRKTNWILFHVYLAVVHRRSKIIQSKSPIFFYIIPIKYSPDYNTIRLYTIQNTKGLICGYLLTAYNCNLTLRCWREHIRLKRKIDWTVIRTNLFLFVSSYILKLRWPGKFQHKRIDRDKEYYYFVGRYLHFASGWNLFGYKY